MTASVPRGVHLLEHPSEGVKKGIPRTSCSARTGPCPVLSTTTIYADAVGEEERHIAARFWT